MYAIVETSGNVVLGVTLQATHPDAIDLACELVDERGLSTTDEAKQEVLDALGGQGYYEQGDYRVTVVEAT
jgi:hypothetical protein